MVQNNSEVKTQILYFSHGGGPLPMLGDPGHKAMVDFMNRLPAQVTRPDLILVISAHWEENTATLLGAQNPPMFHDYYGFPQEAYEITYAAQGSPAHAKKIAALLEQHKIPAAWEQAPSARYCHPREEHLLPLHVCIGMAAKPAKLVFDDHILGKRSVAFLWQ